MVLRAASSSDCRRPQACSECFEFLSPESRDGLLGHGVLCGGDPFLIKFFFWLTTTSILLVSAIWITGIVLFSKFEIDKVVHLFANEEQVKASIVTAYDQVHEYDVTAGVGQFDGLYIPRYMEMLKNISDGYRPQIVPFSVLSTVYSLVENPMYATNTAPLGCDGCDSYLLTGGVFLATPWMPTDYDAYPLVNIERIQAIQLEYNGWMSQADGFRNEDCDTYGSKGFLIGMKMCIADSRAYPGSIIAGTYLPQQNTVQLINKTNAAGAGTHLLTCNPDGTSPHKLGYSGRFPIRYMTYLEQGYMFAQMVRTEANVTDRYLDQTLLQR